MAKLTVITHPALSPGFRLAGVEVVEADDANRACSALTRLMDEGEAGIIAMDAPYFAALDEEMTRRIELMVKPVIVSLPVGTAIPPRERRSRQIAELIRHAIGIRIAFRGERNEE